MKKLRKWCQNASKMEPKIMKNRCENVVEQRIEQIIEKTSKKHRKLIKNWWKNNEKSMSEWTSSPRWKTHSRSVNFFENVEPSNLENIWKTIGFIRFFWYSAFSFRRLGANKNVKQIMQTIIKKTCFFINKTFNNSFKNRRRKKYQKIIKNNAKMEPKVVQKPLKIN